MKERLDHIYSEISKACDASKREADSVKLIAVSKTKPLELLKEAYDLGMRDFGENKVQEMMEKVPQMPEDVRWHMIGHLQKNKVKYIAEKVFLIHSVDSYELALEINKQAAKWNRIIPVLLEVNISGEESKFGINPAETEALARKISALPNVKIEGLMTVPPILSEDADNRKYFAALRELSVDIERKNIDNINMNVLSMGMTDDYPQAILEGANYIRVGTGIFGARLYRVEGER